MKRDAGRAMLGGFVGTVAITLLMYYAAPMMTGQPMDIAAMLGSMVGGSWIGGMALHFINGTVIFPLIFAHALYELLPGGPGHVVYGALLGAIAGELTTTAGANVSRRA